MSDGPEKLKIALDELRMQMLGALFGFQFQALFQELSQDPPMHRKVWSSVGAALPTAPRLVHFGALCRTVATVLLLIAPAAIHRIAFDGDDDARFLRIGGAIVTAALVPLAIAVSADLGVATFKMFDRTLTAGIAGGITLLALLALWYLVPLAMRRR